MGIRLRPLPKFQFLTDAGAPAAGYKVYTYQAGTTTPKATYTDYTGKTSNPNPVVLDARGEADIWFNGTYKIKITDSAGVLVYEVDNFGEGEDSVITGNFNKVKNGGFETDTAGDGEPDDWTITRYDSTSTAQLDSANQIEGANSLKFVSTGAGGGYADSAFFEVQEGKIESISFALKSSVVDVRNVVDVLWYTASKTLISTTTIYDESAANPTTWTNKTGVATPPANARFAKIRVIGCHSSDTTPGTTWFDDVQVVAGATTDRYGVVNLATYASRATDTDDKVVTLKSLGSIVSGFDRCNSINLRSTTNTTGSEIAINAYIPEATWTTIGPTGSGATVESSVFDNIPANAKHLIVNSHVISYDSASVSAIRIVSTRVRAVGDSDFISLNHIERHVDTAFVVNNFVDLSQFSFVPLNSANVFEAYWYNTTDDTTPAHVIHIRGWVE